LRFAPDQDSWAASVAAAPSRYRFTEISEDNPARMKSTRKSQVVFFGHLPVIIHLNPLKTAILTNYYSTKGLLVVFGQA
jgi:hypothetical protein